MNFQARRPSIPCALPLFLPFGSSPLRSFLLLQARVSPHFQTPISILQPRDGRSYPTRTESSSATILAGPHRVAPLRMTCLIVALCL
jgi:hypothetical protein